uniref:Reticulon-like protein n=1 Tax=Musa acuminata subsp. malaccensis TaxID=214687 RepID=A0A804L6L1_MUSAM
MPRIIYDSDSNEQPKSTTRRRRPLHDLLGGEKVADILLWRNKYLSAGVLAGATVIWFLFEVAEYHFLTLLCHISITTMLVVFIWSNVAALMDRYPPRIPKVILSEDAFRKFALSFHAKLTRGISVLHDIASGKDLKLFLLLKLSLPFSFIPWFGSRINKITGSPIGQEIFPTTFSKSRGGFVSWQLHRFGWYP